MEYRFHEQLERVLGSSRRSNASEITYDVEEFNDDEESRDGDEDLQLLGQAVQREAGTPAAETALPGAKRRNENPVCSFQGLGAFRGRTRRRCCSSTRGGKTRCSRS